MGRDHWSRTGVLGRGSLNKSIDAFLEQCNLFLMPALKKEIAVSASLEEETHLALRQLLLGRKLLPIKTYRQWLQSKEKEEVARNGKQK